ncbi:MAG TPA: tetratricopeptide repeat protein [Nitrospira sp.]|nr:tetratricopeptide repeat protein [Nitrospira sp.]
MVGRWSPIIFVLGFLLVEPSDVVLRQATAESVMGGDLPHQLQLLLGQKNEHSSDPEFLVRLADLYLDFGDDDSLPTSTRRDAYEEGAKFARRAMELRERDADTHYLYAANVGSAAQLTGMMASALTIQDLKHHVMRALELNPHHAPALHMMGMMLEELPWFLGGDADGALTYLRRAVASDTKYCHARLDLAKAYIKRKDPNSARRELEAILRQPLPSDASASDRRHKEEAVQLWDSLKNS